MNELYELENKKLQKRQLWLYLLPVIGVVPSLWTLYREQTNSERKKVSRLAVSLMFIWLTAYISLFVGSEQTSDILAFRLLYTNALLTTGYFLICFALMFRLHKGKSPYFSLINFLIKSQKVP